MRVASLYFPNLATDRIRRSERRSSSPERGGGPAAKRTVEGVLHAHSGSRGPLHQPSAGPPPPAGEELDPSACSCPRGGGWRPGARWAGQAGDDEWLEQQIARERSKKAAIIADIEALPLHQRPPVRELGRRSESVAHPFRPMLPDEAARGVRPAYDLDGAFWQQGRSLGGVVAREVGAPSAPQRGESRGKGSSAPAGEQPLVTTRRDGQRVVIAAACPLARSLGIDPDMPLTQARAMVPGLDVRAADPDGDAAALARLARHAARHWTPLVTIAPGEGLWLDIGASAHLFGGEALFSHRLLALCRRLGLAARVAVADTAGAAYALARYGGEVLTLCPPGGAAEAIAALPLAALRLDQAAAGQARRLGIETVGALAAMPRAPLVRRFGADLVTRLDEALGARAAPIEQLVVAETPRIRRRFAEPLLTAEPIARAVGEIVHALAERLAATHVGARALALTLTRIDAAEQRIEIGLARPSRDPDHIIRLFAAKLDRVEPGFGIEAIGIAAERFEPLAPQPVRAAFAPGEAAADLASLIDRLATRLGWQRLYRAGAIESDVPERSVRRLAPTDETGRDWEPWPRPVRLLSPPERVEDVLALLPDGVPKRFTWRGRSYQVVRGDGPERIHGEWWRRAAERDSVRDYFQVEDQSGARFWLFRRGDGADGSTGDLSWHLHGLFA